MKLKITQTDINRGNQLDSAGCPIARSVKRHLRKKGYDLKKLDIAVASSLTISKKGKDGEYTTFITKHLPKKALTFIQKFDSRQTVKPFTLELVGTNV